MTPVLPRAIWVGAALGAFVLGLAIHLPLTVALRWAGAEALARRAAFEGSVLSWRATTADGTTLFFDADPLLLLSARYGGRYTLAAAGTRASGRAYRAWDGAVMIDDAALEIGLAPFTRALDLPPSLLEGRVRVEGIGLRLDGRALSQLACSGEVVELRASGGGGLELGALAIACRDDVAGPVIAVNDRGGPLAFQAEIRFAPDGRYLLAGTAGARPGAPAALRQALPLLGRASGPDQVSFRYAGELAEILPRP